MIGRCTVAPRQIRFVPAEFHQILLKGKRMNRFVRLFMCTALLSMAAPAVAVGADVQHLGGDVSVLIGTSCNVLILPGDNGVLIVDGQRNRDVDETLSAVKSVTQLPVRYVVNTHWHLDHSGGNLAFAQSGAALIAQRNILARRSTEQYMVAYKSRIPPEVPAGLPLVIFDDRLDLRVGSESVELRHVAHAHTDGDTLVHFKNADVIAMGDVYFNHIFPFIDRSSGGSIQGMISAVNAALAMADENSRIVPAHGPVASRAKLVAYRDMLVDLAKEVRSQMRAGHTLAEIVASHPAAAYRNGMEGEEDRLIEAIYDSYKDENLHHRLRTHNGAGVHRGA
jgi:glyoxylase-like metal-dependent hydrolase (beta-lactamase superfamily II)